MPLLSLLEPEPLVTDDDAAEFPFETAGLLYVVAGLDSVLPAAASFLEAEAGFDVLTVFLDVLLLIVPRPVLELSPNPLLATILSLPSFKVCTVLCCVSNLGV